jgi:hypothetical protein
VYNDAIYVSGGLNFTGNANWVERFDGTKWVALLRVFAPRSSVMAVFNNILYLVGGNDPASLGGATAYDGTEWVFSTQGIHLPVPLLSFGLAELRPAGVPLVAT